MRRLEFGPVLNQQDFARWVEECIREIERASAEDIEATVSEFEAVGTITEQRTFNATSADVNDLRNVLATLIRDIKARGQKRAYPV